MKISVRGGLAVVVVAAALVLAWPQDTPASPAQAGTPAVPAAAPAATQAPRAAFGEANWNLHAPAAPVPTYQRHDPATGEAIPLSAAQQDANRHSTLTPLEAFEMERGKQAPVVAYDTDDNDKAKGVPVR